MVTNKAIVRCRLWLEALAGDQWTIGQCWAGVVLFYGMFLFIQAIILFPVELI